MKSSKELYVLIFGHGESEEIFGKGLIELYLNYLIKEKTILDDSYEKIMKVIPIKVQNKKLYQIGSLKPNNLKNEAEKLFKIWISNNNDILKEILKYEKLIFVYFLDFGERGNTKEKDALKNHKKFTNEIILENWSKWDKKIDSLLIFSNPGLEKSMGFEKHFNVEMIEIKKEGKPKYAHKYIKQVTMNCNTTKEVKNFVLGNAENTNISELFDFLEESF